MGGPDGAYIRAARKHVNIHQIFSPIKVSRSPGVRSDTQGVTMKSSNIPLLYDCPDES